MQVYVARGREAPLWVSSLVVAGLWARPARTIQLMVAWGDVPTWVTAGVAFLALIGATLAYRTQSEQLRLQRIQLADQTRVQEREQANLVDVSARTIDGLQAGVLARDDVPGSRQVPVHMLVVINGSKRPIREVTCKIEAVPADDSIRPNKAADLFGELMPYALGPTEQAETFVARERTSIMPVLRAGRKAAFVWALTTAQYPNIILSVRFTDDAGLHWGIDDSLHLEKLAKRDW